MKAILFTCVPLFLAKQVLAQKDTVRWYRQSDQTIKRESNNPEISTFPKYGRNAIVIVENYNAKVQLVNRTTTIDEKWFVGNYVEYYENQAHKIVGQYANLNVDTMTNLHECCFKDGIWTSLSMNGDTLAQELWDRGKFIKEIIAQPTNSLWKAELFVNGRPFNASNPTVQVDKRFDLSIQFFYKNKLEIGKPHVVRIRLIRGTKVMDEREFSGNDEFNKFSHHSWCKENQYKAGDRLNISIIESLNEANTVANFNILIR